MKGRKPRTPEQKAYILAQRNLIKMAEKVDKAEAKYQAAIQELRTVEATLSLDKLQAVQALFPKKEAKIEVNSTITGNMDAHTTTLEVNG